MFLIRLSMAASCEVHGNIILSLNIHLSFTMLVPLYCSYQLALDTIIPNAEVKFHDYNANVGS